MATTTIRYAAPATGVGRTRALGVAGAVLAAVAVWAIAVPLSGTHLLIRFGSGAAQSIGIDYVIGASLAASLAGWGLLALLERRTARARRIWTGIACRRRRAVVESPAHRRNHNVVKGRPRAHARRRRRRPQSLRCDAAQRP